MLNGKILVQQKILHKIRLKNLRYLRRWNSNKEIEDETTWNSDRSHGFL